MSEARSASSDLTTRFAAGVVMIAIACAAIYWGGWPFRILFGAAAAAMLIEWGDMHRLARPWSYGGALGLFAALLAISEWLYPSGQIDILDGIEAVTAESFDQLWIGFAALAALGALLALVTRRVAMGWGFIYVGFPVFALFVIEWARFDIVFWLMLVTWSTDTFAYFAGRSIGGPKLAPRISPNKTWSGLAGGMAGAALVGALAAWAFDLDPLFILAGAPMALLAQLGDLYESRVKRGLGVKDSGAILPGHGGVLDRLDGLLPVSLATLGLLLLILGTA